MSRIREKIIAYSRLHMQAWEELHKAAAADPLKYTTEEKQLIAFFCEGTKKDFDSIDQFVDAMMQNPAMVQMFGQQMNGIIHN